MRSALSLTIVLLATLSGQAASVCDGRAALPLGTLLLSRPALVAFEAALEHASQHGDTAPELAEFAWRDAAPAPAMPAHSAAVTSSRSHRAEAFAAALRASQPCRAGPR